MDGNLTPLLPHSVLSLSSVKKAVSVSVHDTVTLHDQKPKRKPHWNHTPGIRVSLQSQRTEPRIEEYLNLRTGGKRKESREKAGQRPSQPVTLDTGSIHKETVPSVKPGSKVVLDAFIKVMGGAEQSMSRGSFVNTAV